MKTCSQCKVDKPENEYDFRSDTGKLRAHCKDCRRAKVREQDAKNREKKKAYNKEYKQKNLTRFREDSKKRYRENKKSIDAYIRSWRALNPAKLSRYRNKRREAIKNATPPWLTEEQQSEIDRVYEHSADCRRVSGEEYEVDHIVPLLNKNICGLHVPWNLQVLPKDINRSKSNAYEGSWS